MTSMSNHTAKDKSLDCMAVALICVHDSMDCNDWRCGCVGQVECLCLKKSYCCMVGAPSLTLGVDTSAVRHQGECCTVGLYCCEWTLQKPRLCCGVARRLCCLYGAASLPFHDDYVKEPVCAYYFLSCLPECGCCESPPEPAALSYLMDGQKYAGSEVVATVVMDRDEDDHEVVAEEVAEMVGYKDVA